MTISLCNNKLFACNSFENYVIIRHKILNNDIVKGYYSMTDYIFLTPQ